MEKVYDIFYDNEWINDFVTFEEIEDEVYNLTEQVVKENYDELMKDEFYENMEFVDIVAFLFEDNLGQLSNKNLCITFDHKIEIVELHFDKEIIKNCKGSSKKEKLDYLENLLVNGEYSEDSEDYLDIWEEVKELREVV